METYGYTSTEVMEEYVRRKTITKRNTIIFSCILLLSTISTVMLICFKILYIDTKFIILFIIQIIGYCIALYGATRAVKAENQSLETQLQLADIGLLSTQSRENFYIIFEEHLVRCLREHDYNAKPANIFLLLSTPAYGYAVVGMDKFGLYEEAIKALHQECKVQAIFFSPDAHFHYWCNLLMWCLLRKEGLKFAIGFMKKIIIIVDHVVKHNWEVWLTRGTTVRLFAIDNIISKKAYLLLVDQFRIPQDQFETGFKSRSIPILVTQINEYIIGKNNYFDRIKECPYTLDKKSLKPIANQADADLIKKLSWDYVLGRTMQGQFASFKCFSDEVDLYLTKLRHRSGEISFDNNKKDEILAISNYSDEDIVIILLKIIISYFSYILEDEHQRIFFTNIQITRIKFCINKLNELLPELDIFNINKYLINEESNKLKKGLRFLETIKQNQINSKEMSAHIKFYNKLDTIINKLKYCLFSLICSGFGESQYAKSISTKSD